MTTATAPTPVSAAAARWGTSAVFFLNGFIFASWVLHVPTVRDKLNLSPAQLGLALLGIAVGSLLTMPATGAFVARFGSRRVTRVFALLNPLVLSPLLLAPNLGTQMLALVAYGAVSGGLDVAMNAQGVAVERALRKAVLSSFHAWWSLGGLAGAALGSLALSLGAAPLAHVGSVSLVFLIVAALAGSCLLAPAHDLRETPGGRPHGRRGLRAVPPVLWLLGALGFLGLLSEGAVADWSAVYYRDELGASAGGAGLGYAAFTLTMTVGRLLGDSWRARFGGELVLRGGAALAALGLLGALLAPSPFTAALGFAACGLGIANIVPVLFDAASRTGNAGPAIAQVSTLAYLGFLAGPPLVGFVAQGAGLSAGLGLVVALSALIALLSPLAWRARR